MSETLFPIPKPEAETKPEPAGVKGKPRLVLPNRAQVELRPVDLESLLPAEHPARAVWEFVESLDLRGCEEILLGTFQGYVIMRYFSHERDLVSHPEA